MAMASPPSATATALPRRHVAVCPFTFTSHPATHLLLARRLAESAPDVQVSFFTTEASAASLAASFPPEEGSDTVRTHIVEVDGLGPELAPQEAIRRITEGVGAALRRSMAAAEAEVGVQIGCVVIDAFLSFAIADIVAETTRTWVALWTSSTADLAAHLYTEELRSRVDDAQGTGAIRLRNGGTVDKYIAGPPPTPVAEQTPEVGASDISAPFGRILNIMAHVLPTASAIAINSFHPIEPTVTDILNGAFGNRFLSCGPYSLTLAPPFNDINDPNDCLSWLDTHENVPKSVLYVSFGINLTPEPEELTALAEALEALQIPFLWSLPDRCRVHLPEGFVERTSQSGKGKVVPWVPQTSVLCHEAVGAHLTHCGWNSVMECVVAAVPMICRPFEVTEQRFNERLVVSLWGVGVEVQGGKLTRESVTRAVQRLMVDEEGKEMTTRIHGMQWLAEDAAVEEAGTSSLNLDEFISIILN